MCRRPDDRAAHGRHAAAVHIGRDGRECHVGQHPAKQGKAPRPVFAEPTAQKGTVRLPAQTFSRETAKTSARKQGQLLCKNVPVQKRWTRRPAIRRPALRGTRKSIRKRPDCAIGRRAVRACPGVTFRRLRRFFLRLSHRHCAPAYACPLFSRRGKQRSVQGSLQPLQPLQPPQPRQNGAPAPRAEEISGALSPAAQRQRRTRARQRPALSRRPRGRTGVFYRRFMEKAKAASTASAPPAVRRRPAAALRRGALRHGGAASAIWSGQAESG